MEASAARDATLPVCPIRVSGTALTEADCHTCIIPDAPCSPGPVPGLQMSITVAGCINFVRDPGSFHCLWFADGDPIQIDVQKYGYFGASSTCASNPGRVICGGGL